MSDDEEAIMAADDPGYLSPVDGHMHYAIANRDGCAVCSLEDERDRLRAVVDAAREFSAAHRVWIEKARGNGVRSTDEESRNRAATLAALVGLVDQPDAGGEATDG